MVSSGLLPGSATNQTLWGCPSVALCHKGQAAQPCLGQGIPSPLGGWPQWLSSARALSQKGPFFKHSVCEPCPFLKRSHVKYVPLLNIQVEISGGKIGNFRSF